MADQTSSEGTPMYGPLNGDQDDKGNKEKNEEAGKNREGGDGAKDAPEDVGRVNCSEMCMNLMMSLSLLFMTISSLMMVYSESPDGDEWTMYAARILSIFSIILQVFLFLLIIARHSKCMRKFRMWVTSGGRKKKRMVRLILALSICIPILHGLIMAFVSVHMMELDMGPFSNSTNQTDDMVTMETTTDTAQL